MLKKSLTKKRQVPMQYKKEDNYDHNKNSVKGKLKIKKHAIILNYPLNKGAKVINKTTPTLLNTRIR